MTKSPLRFPGGKARAIKHILPLFPKGVKEVVSCFFGGGSVELALCDLGVRVYAYDAFDLLVYFWQEMKIWPELISKLAEKYYPLSKEAFYELQKKEFIIPEQKAVKFYVLNRCSFSGSTLRGGMSPNHPRFTLKGIRKLSEFKCPLLSVERMDFRESLARHPGMFCYADPSYYGIKGLYGSNSGAGDLSFDEQDHVDLANILRRRKGWILSYNDCPEVRALYKHNRIETPQWSYGMSKNKMSKEVLIFG